MVHSRDLFGSQHLRQDELAQTLNPEDSLWDLVNEALV